MADVIRYRLTTNEFIHDRFLSHAQPNAVVKVTGRLVRQGWLQAHPLLDRQQYFVAGSKLVKLHGLPISRTRPLGPQSLASLFAIAKYCLTAGIAAQLATDDELIQTYTWMDKSLLHSPQLIERDGTVVTLRLVRVDLGGTPEHVGKKCVHDLSIRQPYVSFNQMVGAKRFVMVVLTASPAKQELIQKVIAKRQWPKGLRFQLYVVPELAQLLSFS